MNPARSTKLSFRPQVEDLESRQLLSVTAIVQGQTLLINGDGLANNVQIRQNDDSNQITVIGDGQTFQPFISSQITRIQVNLRGGNDAVTYRLDGGSDFEFAKAVTMDLGNGANNVLVDLQNDGAGDQATIEAVAVINIQSLGSFGQVLFGELGGNKNDTAVIRLGKIDEDAAAFVFANLGIGNDSVTVDQRGDLVDNALLDITLAGSDAPTRIVGPRPPGFPQFLPLDGNDTFRVTLDGDVDDDGVVNVRMNGGLGSDTLRLTQTGELDGAMSVAMRGGAGADTLSATLDLEDDSEGRLILTMLGLGGNDSTSDSVFGAEDLELFTRTVSS